MKKQVYAYLHTHWDREWYRNKEDFNIRFLDVFDIVLEELALGKAPFFYLDGQVIALLDYLKYREEKKDLIKKFIKEKKLAIGPYFVSADSYLVNFCSMLKNLDIGLKISKEFGQKEFIGYMADIFGISNSAFQALSLKKINSAVIWRGVNPESLKNNCNFVKNGINTCWLVQGYFNDFLHSGNISSLKNYLDKIAKYSPDNILLPVGADHLGMLKDSINTVEKINNELDDYKIILTSPFEYFKNTAFKNNIREHEFLDNSSTYILQGVYTSRVHQKVLNNKIQNLLTKIIEPLNCFLCSKYSSNIDFIYKTLIKNHAHDGIYGCSTDEVHLAIEARFNKCKSAALSVLKNLISDYMKKNQISGVVKDRIGIFNLSNSKNSIFKIKTPYKIKNSQIISKEQGFPDNLLQDVYKIPVTEDIVTIYTSLVQSEEVDAFSFSTPKILKPKKLTKVTTDSLENPFIKIYVKNKKVFILDKNTKNKIQLKITDIKDLGDSYNFAPCGEYINIEPYKTKVLEDGNIQSSLLISYKDIKLIATLNNISKYVSFRAEVKNKKPNHKLQVSFVTKEKIFKTISDEAFGISKREIDPDYLLKDNIPVKYPKELKTNCFPMQNFVCANEIAVVTKGLNEFEIYKNELKICLIRSTGTISNPKNPARAIPAGPDIKCFDLQYINKDLVLEFSMLFDDYFGAFKNIDLFNEIYATVNGDFKEQKTRRFIDTDKNTYIYGINSDKIVGYNIKENKIICKNCSVTEK